MPRRHAPARRYFFLVPAAAALLGAWLAACGSEDQSVFTPTDAGDESIDPVFDGDIGEGSSFVDANSLVTALALEPPAQTLTLDGQTPGTASYKLKATLKDGTSTYVTAQSLAFDRPDLATAANGSPIVLTAPGQFAGTGTIHAIYGGVEATGSLTVQIHRRDLGSVPQNVATALDGATATDPQLTSLRYPYDKTVFPLGLVSPLVMWNAPASADVYRLRFEETNFVYDLYATVNGLGQLRADQVVWDRVTASNLGTSDPVKVTLSRYDSTGQTAYASAKETWTIAPASLRGAIYYWTASKVGNVTAGHIARIRPGTGAAPEALSTGNADPCMGCHAVSADGTTLVASVQSAPTGDPASYPYTNGWLNGRAWASFDLPSGTVRKQTTMNGGNLAVTPDGKYTVFGGRMQTNAGSPQTGSLNMTLADTQTGTVVTNSGLDAVQLATPPASSYVGLSMPAFSPDGKKLAAVEFFGSLSAMRDNVLPSSNRIVVFPFDETAKTFGATPTSIPLTSFAPFDATGIGYPSFTPDAQWLAFHVGNHSTGCYKDAYGNCDDNVQHRGMLWFSKGDGTGSPVHLAQADTPPASGDQQMSVEPTFNPIERGGFTWVVFTSMRDWGNQLTGTANNGKRRLWVAAIDKSPNGTADPSHPAFYLEGQEDTPNMRGFWTLAACTPTPKPGQPDAGAPDAGGGACQAGFECCSGFCDRGVCVDVSTVACHGIGQSCATTIDCCNGGNGVVCTGGTCQVVAPR